MAISVKDKGVVIHYLGGDGQWDELIDNGWELVTD